MTPDILALLGQLGVPGQLLGYAAAAIAMATILVRALPAPTGTGVYASIFHVIYVVANLKSPGTPPAPPAGPVSALLLSAGLSLSLGACSVAQLQTAQAVEQRAVADGQLFCGKTTADGPLVVALATAAGAPVVVTGAASSAVAAACAVIGALPVAPPANPAAAPVVAANVAPLTPAH